MTIVALRPPAGTPGGYRMLARGTSGEIYLYDVIGGGWFGGVTADQFRKDLAALGKVTTLDVRINSEGGDVFQGVSIHTLLAQHPARVVVHVDGVAASIASLIMMAGDEIRIAAGAFTMVHNPYSLVIGDATEHRRMADLLDSVAGQMVGIYAKRTKQDERQVRRWMQEETWMSADEAVERGFADVLAEPVKAAACIRDPSRYRHPPSALIPRPRLDAARARMAAAAAPQARGARLRPTA